MSTFTINYRLLDDLITAAGFVAILRIARARGKLSDCAALTERPAGSSMSHRPAQQVPLNRFFRSVSIVLAFLTAGSGPPAMAATPYGTRGSCDRFPKVQLDTAAGVCVGLVADHLGFARGVTAIGGDIYVADMGGWQRGKGRILKLGAGGHAPVKILLSGLDEPNALVLGPGGSLYVGELGKIIRFDPKAANPAANLQDIVINLPADGRHPLNALTVAADGSLFINVGSATDHCENADGAAPDPAVACPETQLAPPRGSILHVMPGALPIDARTAPIYARGLRNSMAMAISASGELLVAGNSRDAISVADPAMDDAELPHETYDAIVAGSDYGWPYCFDDDRPSPEYPQFDCKAKHRPTSLLPAHAAPLGMLRYSGSVLPGLSGSLIMAWHGYRSTGHRIVSLPIDANGQPTGVSKDLVDGWDASTSHPRGSPVAVFEMDDGTLLVSEDHNGTLLRISRAIAKTP